MILIICILLDLKLMKIQQLKIQLIPKAKRIQFKYLYKIKFKQLQVLE
jgi:hypothetical protein